MMLREKFYHWWRYTKNCFRIHNPFLGHARKLRRIARTAIDVANQSDRREIVGKYVDTWLPPVIGVYFTTQSYHETVQMMSLSGFGLHALHLVRSQLESLLMFCYFTEPHDDFKEINDRVSQYLDWVIVKMYMNMDKSSDFPVLQALSNYDEYVQQVTQNYQNLEKRYQGREAEFAALQRQMSFLKNKPGIADRHGFKSLYSHIQAESSASIHIVDIADRIEEVLTDIQQEYHFNTLLDEARWALFLSNMLRMFQVKQFAKFYAIEDAIIPLLKQVL